MPRISKVHEIAYHRNGISGEGFHVVLFRGDADGDGPEEFIATVFDGPGQVAVISLDRIPTKGVKFTENSWRGDNFETELRAAIAEETPYEEENT